jgi:hypothetical protein
MEKTKKRFEKLIKEENDLIDLSDSNLLLDRDGDYDNYLISIKWKWYLKGIEDAHLLEENFN